MVFYYICVMKSFKFFSDKTYKTFENLEFKDRGLNKQAILQFDNGYGASVIIGPTTYGGMEGFYGMAILDSNGKITYQTSITDDVIGYLTPIAITEYLKKIQDL